MPTYVSLLEFTQDGVESIDDLPSRDEEGTALLSSMGVEITDHYYTLGQYDEWWSVRPRTTRRSPRGCSPSPARGT